MLHDFEMMSHVIWDCKYHVIITPKYRKKILYGQVRRRVGEVIRYLAKQKEVKIEEGHAQADHIHMVMRIPPKYSVAMVIGFIKGKSAIMMHREFGRKIMGYYGKSLWSRGYYVSTVGVDEETVRRYVREQEKIDKRTEGAQLDLKW